MKIEFESSGSEVAQIHAYSADGVTGELNFQTSTVADTPVTRMTIDSTGNVGIGTGGPLTPLHIIADSTQAIPLLVQRGGSQNAAVQYKNDVGSMYAGLSSEENWAVGPTSNLGSTGTLTVTSGGAVGIGTVSPVSSLQVLPANNSEAARFGQVGGISIIGGGYPVYTSNAISNGTPFDFETTQPNATIGMGIISPMRSPINSTSGGVFVHPGDASAGTTVAWSDFNVALAWDTSGRIGIGTTNPGEKLDVNSGSMTLSTLSATNAYKIGSHKQSRSFRFTTSPTTGNIQPLASFRSSEGEIVIDIDVQMGSSGHSGTKSYKFLGGYNQLTTSWYRLVPENVGRGHGDGPDAFEMYIRRGNNPYTYDFGIGAVTGSHIYRLTFTELSDPDDSRGNAFDDISGDPEETISSAGDVYSHKNLSVEGNFRVAASSTMANYAVIGDSAERLKLGYGHVTGIEDNIDSAQMIVDSGGNLILSSRTNNPSGIRFFTNATTDGTEKMRIDTAGNVGIGTTNPGRLLDVSGISRMRDALYFGANDEHGEITWGAIGGGSGYGIRGKVGRALSLGSNDVWDRLVIDTSGNVGIGSTNPSEALDVGTGNIAMGWELIANQCNNPATVCTATCTGTKRALGGSCEINGTWTITHSVGSANSYLCSAETSPSNYITARVYCANIR
jgi:hypothetical protein